MKLSFVFSPLVVRVLALGLAICVGILLTPAARARVLHSLGSSQVAHDPGTMLGVVNQNAAGGAIIGQVGPYQTATAAGTGIYGYFNAPTGTGQGVIGAGVNGYGVIAEQYGGYFPALLAQNYSPLGGPAVQGIGNGVGVQGQSVKTDAIVGITSAPSSLSNYYAGVVGEDNSAGTSYNVGVLGQSSPSGRAGVLGIGVTFEAIGVEGDSGGVGVGGLATGSSSGVGVSGYSDEQYGVGVVGASDNYIGLGAYNRGTSQPALLVENEGSNGANALIEAQAKVSGGALTSVLSLDTSGNLILSGVLTQSGTPLARTRTSDGASLVAYGPRQSTPTTEDVGEAQLSSGSAYVNLEPQFRRTIDRGARYLVFITPQGNSRNLYVTHKTSAGFEVMEADNGRDSVAFDYRIVAKPYDTTAPRLPLYHDMHSSALRENSLNSDALRSRRHGLTVKPGLHYRPRKLSRRPSLERLIHQSMPGH